MAMDCTQRAEDGVEGSAERQRITPEQHPSAWFRDHRWRATNMQTAYIFQVTVVWPKSQKMRAVGKGKFRLERSTFCCNRTKEQP